MIEVLVVDDDDVFGELLIERLEGAGISAEFQHGPFGTVNRIRREQPKVLIVDVNMPAISGREVCELVRKSPGLEHTKILLMSSMDPAALEAVRVDVGADLALPKSVGGATFVTTLRKLLK